MYRCPHIRNIGKRRKKIRDNIHRIGLFSLDEVLPYVLEIGNRKQAKSEVTCRDYLGYMVNMTSLRYRVFIRNTICVECGVKGRYFALESYDGIDYHFNLYGINKKGYEVLITKDHIVPKVEGGEDSLDNLQTMCFRCNTAKGSRV